MIFSIGYQNLKDANTLISILNNHELQILVDVRSNPYGRNPAFNKNNLKKSLDVAGIQYLRKGDTLGGMFSQNEEDIKDLAGWHAGKWVCLMCVGKSRIDKVVKTFPRIGVLKSDPCF